jgi:hypothetical protein
VAARRASLAPPHAPRPFRHPTLRPGAGARRAGAEGAQTERERSVAQHESSSPGCEGWFRMAATCHGGEGGASVRERNAQGGRVQGVGGEARV